MPVYVVQNDKTPNAKPKVLHWVRLLLWFADSEANIDGIRVNLVVPVDQISDTVTEEQNWVSPTDSANENGTVSCELDYGLNLAKFIIGKDPLKLLYVSCKAKAACEGMLQLRTGHETSAYMDTYRIHGAPPAEVSPQSEDVPTG